MDMRGGWSIAILRQNCFSHSAAKNQTGIFQCFTDSGNPKILGNRGVGHDFCRNFLSHSTEKNHTGILHCFTGSGIEKIFA